VCFDVDGTLVDEIEYIWPLIHRELDIDIKRVKKAKEDFYGGKINFRQWARHDIELWRKKGVTEKDLIGVVSKLKLMKGAREVLEHLKKAGYSLAVISGGLNIVLEHFIPDCQDIFDHIMINRLSFDDEGRIKGIEPTEVGSDEHKLEGLRKIAKKEGISLEQCVFIGDSGNDVNIARGAGLSIGFNPSPELEKVCDVVIRKKDLREVLKHIL
jgi:phosphoserine phosphatase